MAVINDDDKMRDIIAKAAEGLTTDGPDDVAAEESTEGAGDAGDVSAESEGVEAQDDGVADADADAAAAASADGKGAAADVAGADSATAGKAGAEGAKGAAEAGKAGAADKAKAKKDEEHPFAKEHGIKSKDASGRENRIPFSRVLKINENAVKKAKGEWETAVLKPVNEKVRVYEERLGSIEQTEKIMFEQPRRYVAMLQTIPGYKELFNEISGGKWTGEAPKAADGTNLAADANDPEPKPDAFENGKPVGYTEEGLAKLRAWDRRQAAREAAAVVEQKFKPIQDRFSATVASEREQQTIDGIIGQAAAWPGFKENYTAILDVITKGTEKLDTPGKMFNAVQSAYNEIMFGTVTKHKETEEQARARHFDEFQASLKKAPRSTAARSTVARTEPVVEDTNVSADDRMRNTIMDSITKAGLIK